MNDVSSPVRELKPWKTIVVISLLPWVPLLSWIGVMASQDISRQTVEAHVPFSRLCQISLILLECFVIGISLRFIIQRSITIWRFVALHHFTAAVLGFIILDAIY